ncbi:hypothetical protein [Paraclostridium sordellii]|uniref:hypothetical protein n=1 Tax=Paraclostridium sordellii TaxID=1505 RepID=UPI0005DAD3CE|nr:hypothetical protein [Paeniclostridium sordellii]MDU1453178.1 hypothetical protein [Paeniclostridium sordellii]CEP84005.1 Uncharacterised protein [[Clostridium] sordellii] [Paeniclostridium sordellii]CEQ21635.1 Uncharacterised protein [[Clostridium] sordellii] [Paeniclostridium sordellii]CEQ27146.1 Uncharacterised protein [[Clostridium] sordellii] [Paeniclostridium sordellii]
MSHSTSNVFNTSNTKAILYLHSDKSIEISGLKSISYTTKDTPMNEPIFYPIENLDTFSLNNKVYINFSGTNKSISINASEIKYIEFCKTF